MYGNYNYLKERLQWLEKFTKDWKISKVQLKTIASKTDGKQTCIIMIIKQIIEQINFRKRREILVADYVNLNSLVCKFDRPALPGKIFFSVKKIIFSQNCKTSRKD